MKKEVDVKESEITSTVEETCFVNIPEDGIKLENTKIKGNFEKFPILKAQMAEGCGLVLDFLFKINTKFS